MSKGIRIGLTGGIGSGKSTVARFLTHRGAYLIDADAISRAATATGGAAIPAIAQTFGPQTIDSSGALDRGRMREIAFNDPHAKKQLEAIIHPLVGLAIEQAQIKADALSAPCVVYDIPLLLESSHWRKKLETIVVIDCNEDTQIERVRLRSGLSESEVRSVLTAQVNRMTRLQGADHVIYNDGITLGQLEALTQQISAQFGL
jgi:dephospho-CoA kinase